MKVKNDYIEIKIGNKNFVKKNMILDIYLNKMFNSQLYTEHDSTLMNYCFIKFDEPIQEIDYTSNVDPKNYFDVVLISIRNWVPVIKTSNNIIKLIYKYGTKTFLYYNGTSWVGQQMNNFNMFAGKKITALGFGTYTKLYAFLDTSNMNIVVNKNENIQITRADTIKSDGISKGINYPLHLVHDIISASAEGRQNRTYAQLYSVGFGNTMGLMEEEYLINNVAVEQSDNYIIFEVNRTKKIGYYPSKNLQLGFYPIMDNSKYLIFKYRLYTKNNNVVEYLDEYYTMNMPNENFGNLQIKLEIERM